MFPFRVEDKELNKKLKQSFPKTPIYSSIEELRHEHINQENIIRVENTSVIYANYELLQHDFPQLRDEVLERRNPSFSVQDRERLIDDWLIKNTSFISGPQPQQETVNSPIYHGTEITRVHRPLTYGRAVIFSIEENNKAFYKGNVPEEEINDKGLIDVKGSGIAQGKVPKLASHSDGLLTLEDAFIEYLNQQLIQGVFLHSKTKHHTLPMYGIIDLGFDVKHKNGERSRACQLLRRAHTRPKNSGGLPLYGSNQQLIQLEVEQLLRRYGITSVNYVTSIELWKENGKLQLSYGGTKMTHLTNDQLKNIEEVSHFKGERMYFEGVNVQHTGDYKYGKDGSACHLVDFGNYRVRPKHKNPLLSLVSDRLMRWGGAIFPESKEFVKLDKEIAVPYRHWGKIGELYGFKTSFRDLKQDIICRGLAEEYRNEKRSKELILEQLDAYLQTATLFWKQEILNGK